MKNDSSLRKYVPSLLLFLLLEVVAVTLWLMKDNLFYLLNFSYIGCCLAAGTALFTAGKRYARHFVQLAVGCYMLLYLGVISRENMQIEGFWYYLFLGVFEAATIHYAVAKIFGPLLFGRGWCGYACWTAMVLDFLPYKIFAVPGTLTIFSHRVNVVRVLGSKFLLYHFGIKAVIISKYHGDTN